MLDNGQPPLPPGFVLDGEGSQDFSAANMVKNIPHSAAELASGIYQSVRHPIDTAKTLGNLATGAIQSALPEAMQAESAAPQRELAGKVGDYLKQRYGGMENFKKALEGDPVGVLADASILFTSGETAAAKVPGIAKAAKTAAHATNPIALATKAVGTATKTAGNVAADVIGTVGTHTGGASIKEAYRAGRAGGGAAEAFTSNLRGNAPLEGVVDQARGAVSQMRQDRSAAYRSGMAGVAQDKTVLDFKPIDDAFAQQMSVGSFKGKTIDPSTAEVKQKIQAVLDDWRASDPAEFHTPEGFDALKKAIGDIRESTPMHTPSRKVADSVYNSVKKEITAQAPEYAKVMKDYETASDLLREVESALSLKQTASADTALRKLQSVLRSGVNTNYGKRLEMVDQLESAGAPNLRASIAGQSLNQWAPRGMGGATAIGTGGLGYLAGGPGAAIPMLVAQSPRLMGEAAYGTGALARWLATAGAQQPIKDPQLLALLLSEAGQKR